jgi:hypothetical protein
VGRDEPTGDKLPKSNDEQAISRHRGARLNGAAPSLTTTDDGVVDLDVSWLVPADLCAVDALARLQLAVSRRGRWLLLHSADGGLVELLEFVGLDNVVHLCPCCRGAWSAADHPGAGAGGVAPQV